MQRLGGWSCQQLNLVGFSQRDSSLRIIQQTYTHVLRTTYIGVTHQAGVCRVCRCAGEGDIHFGNWRVGFVCRIVKLAVFQINIDRNRRGFLLALITAVVTSPRSTSLSTLSGAMLHGASITTPFEFDFARALIQQKAEPDTMPAIAAANSNFLPIYMEISFFRVIHNVNINFRILAKYTDWGGNTRLTWLKYICRCF